MGVKKMQEKFVLTAASNDGKRYEYAIAKNEKFKAIFIKFMTDLGFEAEEIKREFNYHNEYYKEVKVKIKGLIDICHRYKNKGFDIDIFYGIKKIILIVRVNEKLREKLIKNVLKYTEFREFKKKKFRRKIKMRVNKNLESLK